MMMIVIVIMMQVRMIFFLFDHMDRVLPSSTNGVKFLNSAVVSAAVSQSRHTRLSAPLTITLAHLQVTHVPDVAGS